MNIYVQKSNVNERKNYNSQRQKFEAAILSERTNLLF